MAISLFSHYYSSMQKENHSDSSQSLSSIAEAKNGGLPGNEVAEDHSVNQYALKSNIKNVPRRELDNSVILDVGQEEIQPFETSPAEKDTQMGRSSAKNKRDRGKSFKKREKARAAKILSLAPLGKPLGEQSPPHSVASDDLSLGFGYGYSPGPPLSQLEQRASSTAQLSATTKAGCPKSHWQTHAVTRVSRHGGKSVNYFTKRRSRSNR